MIQGDVDVVIVSGLHTLYPQFNNFSDIKVFIEPDEIAELTYFLTSTVNKSITGSIIPVDGGQGL
jgi:enoyl-[acyl-carrier-protein] reductase (NADH)